MSTNRYFLVYLLIISIISCFEIKMSLYISSLSNVVVYTVCSHCTSQASLVQVILYLRVVLFIFETISYFRLFTLLFY